MRSLIGVLGLLLTLNIWAQEGKSEIINLERKAYEKKLTFSKTAYPGDSTYNVQYYGLNLTVTHTPKFISGYVIFNAKSSTENLTAMKIDLQNTLTVDSILLFGAKTNFQHSNAILTVQLNKSYAKDSLISLKIYYHGTPGSSGFGSFETGYHNGAPTIYTLSEPYGSSDWWPCKDTPADKADSCDVSIRCDSSLKAISNGKLVGIANNKDGTLTWKWHESYPIAQYLISMAISNFAVYQQYFNYSKSDSMEVTHYIYPEFLASNQTNLSYTTDMLRVFSEKFGLYPYIKEKYGHAQFGWGGGMEHQTVTSLGGSKFSIDLISHELAHQWFGDKITCKDWQNIWLNEGFATYLESIYIEATKGKAAYNTNIAASMSSARTAKGSIYVRDISSESEIFNGARSYEKGGCVLHMLRGVVGDGNFFTLMKNYLADPRYAYNVATTEDFQGVAESVYGSSLDYFFKEWIYGENFPVYTVQWDTTAAVNGVTTVNLTILQSKNTTPQFFTMPIQINIKTSLGDSLFTVFNNQVSQSFSLSVKGTFLSLQFDPNNLILKNASVVLSAEDEILMPNVLELSQNYPNPFNPETKISFRTPSKQFLTLKIYDVLGREITTLVNEEVEAGQHEVLFNASNFSSGVYFYILANANQKLSKKLLVLK